MLNSEEIRPVTIAIIELCLSEDIREGGREGGSESVSQSVLNRKFLKFRSKFLEWIRNDLKTFLSLAMPNLYCLDVIR